MGAYYEPLWRYIQINCSDGDVISFDKAEEVADITIGPDFYEYKNELLDYGFRIWTLNKKEQYFVIKSL